MRNGLSMLNNGLRLVMSIFWAPTRVGD